MRSSFTVGFVARIFIILITLAAAKVQAEAPIFLVAGGYGTCSKSGDPLHSAIGAYAKSILRVLYRSEQEAESIVSCFGVTQKGRGHEPVYFVHSGLVGKKTPVAQYIEAVSDYLVSDENRVRPWFIFGQSHGGWLALQTFKRAKEKLGKVALPPVFLVTVDAIDYNGCQPKDNELLVREVFSGREFRSPCNQAPHIQTVDLLPNSALRMWQNIYQDRCRILRSAAMPGALNRRLIPASTMRVSGRESLDQIIDGQYPALHWMSEDLKDKLVEWLLRKRPELDFTMHTALPEFYLPELKQHLIQWHDIVRRSN